MHACLTNRKDYTVYLADVPPSIPSAFGNGMSISVESAFNALKEGGKVTMELKKTFWSELFGSLEDKFGVNWMISSRSGINVSYHNIKP